MWFRELVSDILEKIVHIVGDLVIVVLLLGSMALAARWATAISPPNGPILFEGAPFQLRAKWLIQGFEVALFLAFAWRSIRRFLNGAPKEDQ